MERLLPADIDAERATLGSLLIDRDAILAVAAWLTAEDFYLEKHAWIYIAVVECLQQRVPPDLRTVSDVLRRQLCAGTENRLVAIGDMPYLVELTLATPTPLHVEYYGRAVERAAVRRRLIQAGGKIAAIGFNEDEDVETTLALAQQLIMEIAARRAGTVGLTALDLAERAAQRWADPLPDCVLTGFTGYDTVYGGLRRKNLTVLAARPSVGKTSLMLQVLKNVTQCGYRVLLFSLEMPGDDIEDRLVSAHTGILLDIIQQKRSTMEDLEAQIAALGQLSMLPYVVDSCDSGSMETLESGATLGALAVRTMQVTYREGTPDVIIVDYLQLLDGAERSGRGATNRTQALDRVVRGLKTLAMRLNCVVVAISQLNREIEKRASPIPMLSDLRDSGAIEQIADDVIFIHRPIRHAIKAPDGVAYNTDGNVVDPHLAELHVAKKRNGPIGVVRLWCDLATGRWMDWPTFRPAESYDTRISASTLAVQSDRHSGKFVDNSEPRANAVPGSSNESRNGNNYEDDSLAWWEEAPPAQDETTA